MPRPRLTMEQAEASGALDHNKKRFAGREKAPVPSGPLGDAPNYFDDIERDLWNEIAATAPAGVLTSADRFLVELTAKLLRKLRFPTEETGCIKPVEIGHLRTCLGSMGLTPADRTRVSGPPKRDPGIHQSPIDRLISTSGRKPN